MRKKSQSNDQTVAIPADSSFNGLSLHPAPHSVQAYIYCCLSVIFSKIIGKNFLFGLEVK